MTFRMCQTIIIIIIIIIDIIITIIFLNYEYRLFIYCLFLILLAWLSHDPYITNFMCGIFTRCPSYYGKQISGCLESKWPALNSFEIKINMVNHGKKWTIYPR